jgi:hypothetical protein
VQRPELEKAFGFDTKFAMHMTRVAYQGIELLETGRISFPMLEPVRRHIRNIRLGLVPLDEILEEATRLEEKLVALRQTTHLPDEPNRPYVEDWMISAYSDAWRHS